MQGRARLPLASLPLAAGVGVMTQIVEHQSNEMKARLDWVPQWRASGAPSLRAGYIDLPEGDFNFVDDSACFRLLREQGASRICTRLQDHSHQWGRARVSQDLSHFLHSNLLLV